MRGRAVSDPVARFPHPANVGILACLQSGAVLSASPSVYNVDGFVLRTHPDLSERLFDIAGPRATHCQDAAYGHPVLAASGVVFAVAVSMNALLFRLPEDCWHPASSSGASLPRAPAPGGWRSTPGLPRVPRVNTWTTCGIGASAHSPIRWSW